ncbi:esterase/lipase family protein [Chiayiivirga flava]|uniref:Pimeloyl-ACP methyl ester carboxylesterase n=1 Tax=Chiayiivirga flava TaxID=659595 RepID=A0A7W8FYN9_9GAMM|nr:hypothetical protein [Chiayiivirga flava]MBB5207321.1 pimeloyl-ACP methyl ester carboxylesterase [Chiayiivirga flava]
MIVILHGWSDASTSFEPLARTLAELGLRSQVRRIFLGDYVSMDDDVTFDDIVVAMQRAWREAKLPTGARSVDLVVHSTGALVARYWMTRFFRPDTNPIHRLLMLAPANFGSPHAHKGLSFLGRVVKGYKAKRLFHTGRQILRGLEMASAFTWDLARTDRFDPKQRWYGRDRVLATVLVGTKGYSGIAAAANTPGSDGTVLVSTANLDPSYMRFDFATTPEAPTLEILSPNGATAFCRIPRENHSTIARKDGNFANPVTPTLIAAALTVDDAGFDAHLAELSRINAEHRREEAATPYTHGYQNTVFRVDDNHGAMVPDYFIEAFARTADDRDEDAAVTAKIQNDIIASVQINQVFSSFRAIKINCDRLQTLLIDRNRPLNLRITASPEFGETGSVGYNTLDYHATGSLRIDVGELGRIFRPDRTLLAQLVIRRHIADSLVSFRDAPD